MTYNLLYENWIRVLYNTGETDRLGIRATLEQAHRIRGIAASNPMDRLAILRFLLALLCWYKLDFPGTRTKLLRPDRALQGIFRKALLRGPRERY